jgi:hypothetical protein
VNKKQRLIGIMVSKNERRKSVLKQYLPYSTSDDVIFSFTPQSIDWDKKIITGLHYTSRGWEIAKFPFPKAVYNRCYEIQDSLIQRLENVMGKGKCFNHRNKFDKLLVYRHLRKEFADFLPPTVPFDEKTAAQMLERYPVLYFKPCYGNGGKGVIRAARQINGEIHIGDHYFVPETIVRNMKDFQKEIKREIGGKPYLVQAGIPIGHVNGQIFDIRALVQKNGKGKWSVTNMISRIASPGSFNTSMCDAVRLAEGVLLQLFPAGTTEEILSAVREISLKAASVLEKKSKYHLGELSVDFALDNEGKLWMIELNGKPQKVLYEDLDDVSKVYQRPMEYARHLARQAN